MATLIRHRTKGTLILLAQGPLLLLTAALLLTQGPLLLLAAALLLAQGLLLLLAAALLPQMEGGLSSLVSQVRHRTKGSLLLI